MEPGIRVDKTIAAGFYAPTLGMGSDPRSYPPIISAHFNQKSGYAQLFYRRAMKNWYATQGAFNQMAIKSRKLPQVVCVSWRFLS